jgi:hypothetical protein
LITAAEQGMVPLKDACLAVRARIEDPTERAARQHAARTFRMWTAGDGMLEGHCRLTPEVGGRVKAAVDTRVQGIFRSRRKHGPHESHDAYAADALAERFDESPITRATTVTATVHVVVDHGALARGTVLPGERCEIPGNRGYLELDHCEVDFAKGGPAAWWNLEWFCSVDHDRKTRGWNLGPRDPVTGKRRLEPP